MGNNEIKRVAKEKGVYLWQIAEKLGMNDGNFSRKLRHELTDAERDRVLALIEEIAEEGKA